MFKNLLLIAISTSMFQLLADAPKVCFISIGSHDEKEEFVEHLMKMNGASASTIRTIKSSLGSNWATRFCNLMPGDNEAAVYASLSRSANCNEIVTTPNQPTNQSGSSGWLDRACNNSETQCDSLIISGHFDGGLFYEGSRAPDDRLTLYELQRLSCNGGCPGLISRPSQVMTFACSVQSSTQSLGGERMSSDLTEQENWRARTVEGNQRSYQEQIKGIFDAEIVGFTGSAPLGAHSRSQVRNWLETMGNQPAGAGGLRGFQSVVNQAAAERAVRPLAAFVEATNRTRQVNAFVTPTVTGLVGMDRCRGYSHGRRDPSEVEPVGQDPIRQLLCSMYFPFEGTPSVDEAKVRVTQALNTLMGQPSWLANQPYQEQLACPRSVNQSDCWRYYFESVSVFFADLPSHLRGLSPEDAAQVQAHIQSEIQRIDAQGGELAGGPTVRSRLQGVAAGRRMTVTQTAETAMLQRRLGFISDSDYQSRIAAMFPNLRSGNVTSIDADFVCRLHNKNMLDMSRAQFFSAVGLSGNAANGPALRLQQCFRY